MPRKSDAKSRFIQTAMTLFQERGYYGVGLTEIIEAADAPKGSFYHHFPNGKEELAEHAIRKSGRFVERLINDAFNDAKTFSDGVKRLIDIIVFWFEQSEWKSGCPITTVTLETTPQNKVLTKVTRDIFDAWISCAADHAKRLGIQSEGRDVATQLFIMLEGAWVLARVQQSRRPFDIILETMDNVK